VYVQHKLNWKKRYVTYHLCHHLHSNHPSPHHRSVPEASED
jgi:hypothetical protein